MDGAFKNRLDQIFGGLGSSQSTSWSVSGAQIDRRQWRPAGEPNSDDEDEEQQQAPKSCSQGEQGAPPKRFRCEDDENDEVEAMVGMDTTLDFEDEEDEYDKVAVGREGADDRLYTDDIKGGSSVHRRSFREARDDRAHHPGAAERLAEDAREAELSGSADVYKRFSGAAASEKRKRGGGDDKRRVRFQVEETLESRREKPPSKPKHQDRYKNVPDHVRHPEKYTHYTLDWAEEETSKSNASAWRETMNVVGDKQQQREEGLELPEHITFIPPRSREKKMELLHSRASPAAGISIAAAMEEDESNNPGGMNTKLPAARSYRSRVNTADEE